MNEIKVFNSLPVKAYNTTDDGSQKPFLIESDELINGQMALHYGSGNEILSMKNSDGEIISMPLRVGNNNIGYVNNSDVNPFESLDKIYDWVRECRDNGIDLYTPQDNTIFYAKTENGGMYEILSPEPVYESLNDPDRKHKKEKFNYGNKLVVRRHVPCQPKQGLNYYFQGGGIIFEIPYKKIHGKWCAVQFCLDDYVRDILEIPSDDFYNIISYCQAGSKNFSSAIHFRYDVIEQDPFGDGTTLYSFVSESTESYRRGGGSYFRLGVENSRYIIKCIDYGKFFKVISDDGNLIVFRYTLTQDTVRIQSFNYNSSNIGEFVNQDTTSPYLKVIDGKVVNYKKQTEYTWRKKTHLLEGNALNLEESQELMQKIGDKDGTLHVDFKLKNRNLVHSKKCKVYDSNQDKYVYTKPNRQRKGIINYIIDKDNSTIAFIKEKLNEEEIYNGVDTAVTLHVTYSIVGSLDISIVQVNFNIVTIPLNNGSRSCYMTNYMPLSDVFGINDYKYIKLKDIVVTGSYPYTFKGPRPCTRKTTNFLRLKPSQRASLSYGNIPRYKHCAEIQVIHKHRGVKTLFPIIYKIKAE